jgi:hypothetical protein
MWGFVVHGGFQPYCIASLDPLIPALALSLVATIGVSLLTITPPGAQVRRFFCRTPAD